MRHFTVSVLESSQTLRIPPTDARSRIAVSQRATVRTTAATDLQEVHGEEEQQQEGRREEEAVQEEPADPSAGHLGGDPVLHEEVEEVTQWPCEEEPGPRSGGEQDCHSLDVSVSGPASPPSPRFETLSPGVPHH